MATTTLRLNPIINEITINGISYANPTPGLYGGQITIPAVDATNLFRQGGLDFISSNGA